MNNALFTRLLVNSVKNEATGCMEWALGATRDGYGKVKVGGKTWRAHRAMWMAVHGDAPQGMMVCHRCDNPKCVNVEHLFLGTAAENMADKLAKGRYKGGPSHWKTRSSAGCNNVNARINDEIARQIRGLRRSGVSAAAIAQIFNIASQTVYKVASGRSWKHVEGELA